MTASGKMTQYNGMPKMYCHTTTDIPNDAASDSATVPTITSAATRLRVRNIMMSRMRPSEANAAISRSYFWPSAMSLYAEAVPAT